MTGCSVIVTFLACLSVGLSFSCNFLWVLIYFSLTVKAATLIFISGRGSAISSAKEGKSGFIYNCQLFGPRKRACIS